MLHPGHVCHQWETVTSAFNDQRRIPISRYTCLDPLHLWKYPLSITQYYKATFGGKYFSQTSEMKINFVFWGMRPPQLLSSSPVISWPRTLMFSWDCSRRLITTLERARQTMTMCQSCSILTWCSVRVWESILPSPLTLEGELIICIWLHQSWDMRGSLDTLGKTTSPTWLE